MRPDCGFGREGVRCAEAELFVLSGGGVEVAVIAGLDGLVGGVEEGDKEEEKESGEDGYHAEGRLSVSVPVSEKAAERSGDPLPVEGDVNENDAEHGIAEPRVEVAPVVTIVSPEAMAPAGAGRKDEADDVSGEEQSEEGKGGRSIDDKIEGVSFDPALWFHGNK